LKLNPTSVLRFTISKNRFVVGFELTLSAFFVENRFLIERARLALKSAQFSFLPKFWLPDLRNNRTTKLIERQKKSQIQSSYERTRLDGLNCS
jgi:hypothetical protein